MDVVGTTGWLAALAARPDGGRPLPAEEALALASTLARRLADETADGTGPSAALPPVLQAPELLAGGAPGPVSDVYALTAGLWTMLAGRPPHVRDGEDDVPAEVLAVRRVQAPDDVPDLPAPVTALLLRGLAVDPAERPQDAAALAEALDDCAGLVDYARRRELGQRYRPRPVTPRLTPDGVASAEADAPVGPVTPVDPLPVIGSRGRGRRLVLLVAVLAVAAGVAVLLVPGLRAGVPGPGATPGPSSSVDAVVPAGGTAPGGTAPGTTSGAVPPAGVASSAVGVGGASGASSAGTVTPGAPPVGGGQPSPGASGAPLPGASSAPAGPAPTTTAGTTPPVDPNVPPVTPPTRVPPITDTIGPPLPTA